MANPNDIRDQALQLASVVEDALRGIAGQIGDLFEQALSGADRTAQATARDLQSSFNKFAKVTDDIASNAFKIQQGLLDSKKIQEQINTRKINELSLGTKLVTVLRQQGVQADKIADLIKEQQDGTVALTQQANNLTGAAKGLVEEYMNAVNYNREYLNQLEDQDKLVEAQQKKLKVTGNLLEGISKIPVLGKMLGAEKALAAARKKAAEEGSTGFQVLGAGLKKLGGPIKDTLLDPVTTLTAGVGLMRKLLTDVDKLAVDTARNFGLSKVEANDLNKSLTGIALRSNDAYITTARLNESFKALNTKYGTFAKFSADTLITFTQLTQKAKLSAEAALSLQDLTFLTGKDLKAVSKEYSGQVSLLKLQTGLALNEKEILEAIKNVSAATKLQLGGSAKAIAEAVFKVKQLGLELKDLESTSSALLNFQSSIEDELSAELLSGRQLNLEGARYAALMGDQAMLADELATNLGTAADFTGRTVLEQEAIAKALGMSRESLAQTLLQREALNKLEGEGTTLQERYNALRKKGRTEDQIAAELGDKNLAKQLETLSIQERFQSITERLQEPLLKVAEALLPIVDGFAKLVSNATVLKGLIGVIATVIGTRLVTSVAMSAAAMGLFGANAKQAALASIATAGASVVTSASAVPIVGWIAGIAAVAGLIGTLLSVMKADDMYSPGGGYGKRVLLAPEGAFALNDRDNIIATTNPVNPTATTGQTSGRTQVSIAPANTQITLNLNSAAIGNVTARQNYKVSNNIRAFGGSVDYSAPI